MDGLNQQPFPVSIIKCFFFVFFICILYQLNDVVWLRGLLDAGCNSVALVCLLYFQFKPNFYRKPGQRQERLPHRLSLLQERFL